MPVIPSLIDVFIALVISILFFLLVIVIGFTLAALQKPEGHSMPAACFALPLPRMVIEPDPFSDEALDELEREDIEYDPDFYNTDPPDSLEDQDMRERDWL